MKLLMVAAVLAVLCASPARAAKGDKWIGVQLGSSVPTQDMKRSARTGLQGGFALTSMQSEWVGVGVDFTYHAWASSHEANARLASLFGPGSSGKLRAVQTTLHLLYDFRPRGTVSPYVRGGVGLYGVKSAIQATGLGVLEGEREWEFAYIVGAGINSRGGPGEAAIGVGATYHIITSTGLETSLYTVGLNLLWGIGVK